MKRVIVMTAAGLILGRILTYGTEISWGNDIYVETGSGEEYVMGYNNAYIDNGEEIFIVEKAAKGQEQPPMYVIKEDKALYQYDVDKSDYFKKLDNVKDFIAGYALTYDNELYAWGNKVFMGIGATEDEYVTEPIKIMDDVKKLIKATTEGTFVIKTDGSLWAWGRTGTITTPPDYSASYAITNNQLGVGDDAEMIDYEQFVKVCINARGILDNVQEMYSTSYVKFALTETGELYGWGMKKWNSLLNISSDEATPQLLLDDVFKFETAGSAVLATRKDGSLWAWGEGFENKPAEILKNVAYVVCGNENNEDFMFALCRNGDLYTIGKYARKLSDNLSFAVKISVGIKSIMYGDYHTMAFVTENDELYVIEQADGQFKRIENAAEGVIWARADSRYNFGSYRPFVLYVDKNNDLYHVDLTEDGESMGKIISDVKPKMREMPEFASIGVYVGGDSVVMDGAPPYIKNNRTMVPMRAIFERLGAHITWNDETKTAIGVKGDTEVKITIGESVLYKNGKKFEIDAPAEIINGRTMVPVRAISEALGCEVNWDDDMKVVCIIRN